MLTVYTDLPRRICRILSLEDKICFKAQSSFSETIVADYSDLVIQTQAVKSALVTVAINPNMNTAEPRKDAAMCFQLTKTISLQSIDKIWVALFKMLGSQFDQRCK